MKAVIVVFSLVAACLAAEYPASGVQRGLLVLPKPGPAGFTSQSRNENLYSAFQEQQTPEILRPEFAERRGVYFVEVPQERIQALFAKSSSYSQASQDSEAFYPARYNQEPSTPVNVRYLPLETPQVPEQYRAAEPAFEATVKYVPVPLGD